MRSLRLASAATLVLAPLALIPAAPAHAVDVTLTGDVVDSNDAALAGVTVRASGGVSTTTDAAGDYSLTLGTGRYTIEYAKAGYATTTYDGYDTAYLVVDGAGDVTVEVDGESEPLEDGVLDTVALLAPAPSMVSAPTLAGTVAPGETVEATVGTWNPDIKDVEAGEDWRDYVTLEWFLDGKPADDYSDGYYFQKFEVPAEAGGRQLSFRLTVEDDADIWAPITYTSTGVAVPKADASLKASYAGGKVKVVVTVDGAAKPVGQVTVTEAGKKVGKAKLAASKKGKTSVPVKLKKGKHKLVVTFTANGVETATTKLKVRI